MRVKTHYGPRDLSAPLEARQLKREGSSIFDCLEKTEPSQAPARAGATHARCRSRLAALHRIPSHLKPRQPTSSQEILGAGRESLRPSYPLTWLRLENISDASPSTTVEQTIHNPDRSRSNTAPTGLTFRSILASWTRCHVTTKNSCLLPHDHQHHILGPHTAGCSHWPCRRSQTDT